MGLREKEKSQPVLGALQTSRNRRMQKPKAEDNCWWESCMQRIAQLVHGQALLSWIGS